MAYVPPHLRKKSTNEKPSETPLKASRSHSESSDNLLTLFDLHCHFWSRTHEEHVGRSIQSTLNASAQSPSLLTYIVLHFDQNPRWKSDGIIFVKSNLIFLPEFGEQKERAQNAHEFLNKPNDDVVVERQEENTSSANVALEQQDNSNTDLKDLGVTERESPRETQKKPLVVPAPPIEYVPSEHPPIAVFEQIVRLKGDHRGQFAFVGWYFISQISILAPNSQELVRMLGQKWTKLDRFGRPMKEKQRDENAWKTSLKHEWAVLKLEKMKGENVPLPPHIEHIENVEHANPNHDTVERKSVNELLAEMRLRDKEGGKAQQDTIVEKNSEVSGNE